MYLVFLAAISNEIIGLLPITVIQGGYLYAYANAALYQQVVVQAVIALAFATGNFGLYFLGKYGSVPILKFFKKYRLLPKEDSVKIVAKFHWILLMRAIPFFPAKHVSVALGAMRYDKALFFTSSLIGIFLRGLILLLLFRYGLTFMIS
jgi:membrane protein DedA with SNARE-associated domain